MRLFLYDQPIPYSDICNDCKIETPHSMQFLEYDPKKHKVKFVYYCNHCYEGLGDKCPAFVVTLHVNEWIALVSIYSPDN